ncbi:MAG: acetyltransferase [Bryobacteraceae bacterium]|nr:acetyltransferase [Bryobacteraceae bacterium]
MTAIRPSTPADTERLHAIWLASVKATHHFLAPADLEFFSRLVRDEYLPKASLWVAIDDNHQPVAFLGATGNQLDALFTHPSSFGRGIGRALIRHAFPPGVEITLEVNEANTQARAFYAKLGLREIGRSELDGTGKPYPLIQMAGIPEH